MQIYIKYLKKQNLFKTIFIEKEFTMNTTLPIYDIVIDDNSIGLTAISLVDAPAIMTDFLAFKEQSLGQMIWLSSRDKHEIVSPILIPNQLILRRAEDGSLYYIRWTADTIKLAAEKYIANGLFNNFTVMHPTFYNKDMKYTDALEKDIYMLRMWTIDNVETDDANTKYGFNLPEGTLMVHLKVHNRKIWSQVKSGELKGLSIECFSNMVKDTNNDVKINVNMDVTQKQMNLFQRFIQFMNEVSAEAKDISDIAKKDGTDSGEVSLKYYIDDEHYIEVDAEGFARDEEYNLVNEGEYKLADGNTIVVDSNNKFVETKTAGEESEEQPLEAPIAEKKVEDEDENKEDETVDGGESGNTESEGDAVGDEEGAETPAEENAEPIEEPTEEVPTEEPTEETPTEEPTEEIPTAVMPYEIDGVEYLLPQEVIDYINSLVAAKDSVMSELAMMKERIPSAQPIPTVIKQGAVDDDETDGLFEAVRLLNRKK